MATKKYKCAGCGKELPDDHLVVGKNKHYCSFECVPAPADTGKMSESEKQYKAKCISFWQDHYNGDANIPMLIRQAKLLFEEYSNIGMNYKLLYNILCYSEIYEKPYDSKYNLRQIDGSIYPCLNFLRRLSNSKRTVLINKAPGERKPAARIIRTKFLDEEGWL